MNKFSIAIIPIVILVILLCGLIKKVKIFDCFLEGANEGLRTVIRIAPTLIGLITAVSMLTASGAIGYLTELVSPLVKLIGIPPELLPLGLLRPISGGGSTAVATGLLKTHGADSFIGYAASVLMGSSETTLYVYTLYFGSVGAEKTRYALPVALAGDIAGIIFAVMFTMLLY